ncbi:dual specificity testis-specific protein kinase 2 isoform X3 [Nycticebus coucang]|uniref:dual specificity testis-specific protein kinase 2 isoform X3 n=1 Tax=Nycticebus coucang TaxID=9470 RepID=UPI00234DD141|nr:dual specificity testis-specific protein kinase 2 isoform X3 [Nycticebus coucang]
MIKTSPFSYSFPRPLLSSLVPEPQFCSDTTAPNLGIASPLPSLDITSWPFLGCTSGIPSWESKDTRHQGTRPLPQDMNRRLSWSEQLDALLSATDGNVARIKQRLYPFGISSADRLCAFPILFPSARHLAETWVSSHQLPPKLRVQTQTPTAPEKLIWPEVYSSFHLWDEVTVLRSQLQSQAQVTEALRQAVQGLVEEQEQQKYQIGALEASLRLLQGGPERRALLEQRLEEVRRELQSLRSQVQEHTQVQARMQTGPLTCSPTTGLHQELQTEPQGLGEEAESLLEELKLLRHQLSQHRELLLKQMAERRLTHACSWKDMRNCPWPHEYSKCAEEDNHGEGREKGLVLPDTVDWQMLKQLQSGQKGKGHTLEATSTKAQDARQKHDILRTSVHVLQSKLPLATTFGTSLFSSSSEVNLLDSNSSWELLWQLAFQRSILSNLEPSSFHLHTQSLEEETLLQGSKMRLSDL